MTARAKTAMRAAGIGVVLLVLTWLVTRHIGWFKHLDRSILVGFVDLHNRRFVPRVVLVFDADAGGDTGVDRALDLFASQDMDLAVATLPEGLDPCDLLVRQGPAPLQAALTNAVDLLEFKLNRVLDSEGASGVEGALALI